MPAATDAAQVSKNGTYTLSADVSFANLFSAASDAVFDFTDHTVYPQTTQWAMLMPAWDGGDRLALTSRIGRMVAMVDVSDETKPRVLWREKLVGNPDRSFFWQGHLVVPCGYQGLLIER